MFSAQCAKEPTACPPPTWRGMGRRPGRQALPAPSGRDRPSAARRRVGVDTGLGSDLDSPSAVWGRLGVDMGPGSGVTASGRAGERSGRLRRWGRGGVSPSAAPRGSAARGALRAPPEAHPGRGELGSGRGRGAPGESSWGSAGGRAAGPTSSVTVGQ